MHPSPAFRGPDADTNLAFARSRGFGVLTVAAADGVLAAHVPFWLSEDGKRVEAHLVRSNPLWGALETPLPALMAVSGPDAYISPDWYGEQDRVPTWNYVAVHLRGTLSRLPQDALRGHLDRLSAAHEAALAPKPAWTSDKMSPGVMDRMMRSIVPVQMSVETVDGTWKLGQNRTPAARDGAAAGLDARPPEPGIAALMRAIEG